MVGRPLVDCGVGAGALVRDPVDLPPDRLWHRHVLGCAGRRPDRQRGDRRRGPVRRARARRGPAGGRDDGPHADGSLAAADALNDVDVAIVQHEYGIHGGRDGADVIDILEALVVPSVVVAHTVLRQPSAHQRVRARARLRRGGRGRGHDGARPATTGRRLRRRRRPCHGDPARRDDAVDRRRPRLSRAIPATGCAC